MTSPGETALVRALTWQQKVQEAVAHNLANVSSPGFKRGQLVAESAQTPFADVLDGQLATAPTLRFQHQLDLSPGDLLPSGDNSQVALDGPGFLAERAADGRALLHRGGSLMVDANGVLRSGATGAAMLSANGGELVVGTDASSLRIAPDGTLRTHGVDGEQVIGQLGVFEVTDTSRLQVEAAGRFSLPRGVAPLPASDGSTAVRQGYLEQSNVDSLTEMVRMIAVQRGFQGQARALTSLQRMQGEFATQFDR